MNLLQKLFAAHGSHYLERFAATIPAAQRKALGALTVCRTPAAGLLLCACPQCERSRLVPRSCGNRHCPTCQGAKAFGWLEQQCLRALPTHHFMITFTVPEPLRAFLRSNPRAGSRFDVLEFLPGEEAQVDYGQGALTLIGPGKYKLSQRDTINAEHSYRAGAQLGWNFCGAQVNWTLLSVYGKLPYPWIRR